MKNHTYLLLLLLLPTIMRAQNESIEFYPDFNGKSSIVREWKQNSSIVLAYNDLDTGFFLLVRADTMTAHAANIPFETKIFDFLDFGRHRLLLWKHYFRRFNLYHSGLVQYLRIIL